MWTSQDHKQRFNTAPAFSENTVKIDNAHYKTTAYRHEDVSSCWQLWIKLAKACIKNKYIWFTGWWEQATTRSLYLPRRLSCRCCWGQGSRAHSVAGRGYRRAAHAWLCAAASSRCDSAEPGPACGLRLCPDPPPDKRDPPATTDYAAHSPTDKNTEQSPPNKQDCL